ncbi:hypothetical protein GSI_01168 [Ganoderma sinense ZZ0214-1]|uniref:Mid2 domain-containing protein n=1 Tax=Ganoderma sinense ZZ0214-1 TaxID=1077348 RepID=A0A2G8SUP3_9APHY|nr:hypothetical protein GSI_01168 [Ganoderma sinense ZZ0214-1]
MLSFKFFLALSLFAASVNSTPLNVTIDDEFGDEITGLLPIYSPAEEWEQGLTCISCNVNVFDVALGMSQIYQATWHEATHQAGGGQTTITVSFTGSAVYVYHIVANSIPDVITSTQLSFDLDGKVVGHYSHTPDSSDTILYNVPVFVSTELANTAHTLIIRGGGRESLLLFDYVAYTSEDAGGSSSSSSKSSSTSTSTSSLPSTPTLVSTSPKASASSLPSISPHSSSSQNLSFTPSQTPSQPIASTHTLQTNSSSSSPTITSSPRRSSHVSTRAIVGATVGSIAAFLLVCALLFCRIRRRNQGRPRAHIIALDIGNGPATPVDDDPTELETDSVLEIKHLSPIWKPLVPLPSYLTRSRSASSGAAVTTVDAYGHSPESGPDVRRRDGLSGRSLRKDIMEIREQLARLRARRGRL